MMPIRTSSNCLAPIVALSLAACASSLPPAPIGPILENREQPVTAIVPPLDAVCRLQVQRRHVLPTAGYFSSGAYVGDGLVVTAGHNLYSSLVSSVDAVAVECGAIEHHDGAGRMDGFTRNMVAVWPGHRFEDYRDDTALLRIPERPTAAFEVAPDDLVLEKGQDVYLAGFPGTGYGEGQHMYSARGKLLRVDQEFLEYGIVTATGNSGGPVWVERDGHFLLVGVHVAGAQDFGTARRVAVSRIARLKALLGASP
jgi:V8-like Glu-specific endopeptidase